MTAAAGVRYEKLPGHRRGFIWGASVWMGEDHLLSVRSLRFREEYKRFHLGDIQAISVAQVPRFHISTRAVAVAILWSLGGFAVRLFAPRAISYYWLTAVLVALAWAVVSWKYSCRCRILTAVSKDELPSIYRTWTARKFLERVEPRIAAVQGAAPVDWVESVEERNIGPVERVDPVMQAGVAPAVAALHRSVLTDAFVVSLLAGGAAGFALLRAKGAVAQWTPLVLIAVQLACAVLIFAQCFKGRIRPAWQKLALGNVLAIGLMFYVRQFAVGVANARPNPTVTFTVPILVGTPLLRGVEAGLSAALGLAGLVVTIWGGRSEPAGPQ